METFRKRSRVFAKTTAISCCHWIPKFRMIILYRSTWVQTISNFMLGQREIPDWNSLPPICIRSITHWSTPIYLDLANQRSTLFMEQVRLDSKIIFSWMYLPVTTGLQHCRQPITLSSTRRSVGVWYLQMRWKFKVKSWVSLNFVLPGRRPAVQVVPISWPAPILWINTRMEANLWDLSPL